MKIEVLVSFSSET